MTLVHRLLHLNTIIPSIRVNWNPHCLFCKALGNGFSYVIFSFIGIQYKTLWHIRLQLNFQNYRVIFEESTKEGQWTNAAQPHNRSMGVNASEYLKKNDKFKSQTIYHQIVFAR